ncbi:Ubiquitin carboxyl-terminal hydrolase [Rhodotorula toruloides ATCC 204091]|uniref:Ubiquitin carboxyl-terminal hydrolase n=1 Tax=Rhodotorula toruloides TaxID=5286 RepID=A0A0K3CD58_RHOTO|nr:Ubiquitin carboxyl-terminal hydrolase [Rhodotorula toruloides ATCC 204091]KAK4330912.1 Ubiquitin carboxyl-terminal hydrolase 3 [Rhodotorula toruloides]PRQ75582.1 hypothetical protein AAT19DRAFT_13639 [Rhodotorula toruloides]
MATPTAGPSRQATPSHPSTSANGRVSTLNPHSASFSFLQPDSVPSTSAAVHHPPPAPFPYEQHPFPISSFSPPHPNGMYGSPGPYSPYPISSSNGMAGGSGMHGAGGPPPPPPWAAAGKGLGGGGGNGGWNAGPPPFAQHGMHQPTHPHGQPPYFQHHGPPPPPAPSRIPPPPVPPPGSMATNGILFPLPAPQHPPAVAAAAGYPPPGASGLPHSHVHPPSHPPHPLLPPFSPQRPPPPSSSAPRLIPAPSLPVSPASPLPPPSTSPSVVPPSLLPEAVVPSPSPSSMKAASQEGESKGESEAVATAPPPRRLGIRRRKDHLPAPQDAQPFSFAPHLRVPAGFGGKFRTVDSLSSSASATGRSEKGTPGRDKSATASSATSSAPSTPKTQSQTPLSPPTTTASTPAQAPREPATPKQGGSLLPAVAPAPASPAVTSPSTTTGPNATEAATSGSSAPVSPKSPAAPPVKRSWADLVRPPPGAAPPVVPNGITPISASTTLPGAAHPGVPETLLGLLSLPPSHIHQPQAPNPRGLINNGNLCFANATLQALVYCGAFWNLLGLIERGTKKDLREAMAGKTEKDKSERSAVEAMIAFLAEFRTSVSSTSPAFDPAQNTSSSANADASTSSGTSTPKPPFNNNVHPPISSASSVASSSSATSQPAPLSPTPIHDSLRHNPRFDAMRRGTQEDAEEFLGFFLETLHEEVVKIMELEEKKEQGKGKGKAISQAGGDEGWEEVGSKGRVATTRTTETKESPITRIFGGKLRSVLRCPGQKDSVTIEPFQRLQLDIQPDHVLSIEDALVQLTAPESLPDYVTSRGRTLDATKQVFLDALPPVLILHLKRFLYDEVGGVQKSTKKVAYGTELAIDERVMSAPLKAQVGRAGAKYELFGVVYHHGLHASGGHYTVAVRRGYHSPTWLELDDTYMRTLDAKEVAVRPQSAKARRWETASSSKLFDDDADQKNAYLLLYAKVDEEK